MARGETPGRVSVSSRRLARVYRRNGPGLTEPSAPSRFRADSPALEVLRCTRASGADEPRDVHERTNDLWRAMAVLTSDLPARSAHEPPSGDRGGHA